jgi:hypothetical protein
MNSGRETGPHVRRQGTIRRIPAMPDGGEMR